MGFREFIVSKAGAVTAVVTAAVAGICANIAIAETLKDGLMKSGIEQKALEYCERDGVTLDYFYAIIDAQVESGNPYAIEVMNELNACGEAAAATAYYQPASIIGAVAVFGAVIALFLIARRSVKKSMEATVPESDQ